MKEKKGFDLCIDYYNVSEDHHVASRIGDVTANNINDLFQQLKLEHGECIDVIFLERAGEAKTAIGWVFERERHYNDKETENTYIQRARITVFASRSKAKKKVISPKHLEESPRVIETYVPAKYMDVSAVVVR